VHRGGCLSVEQGFNFEPLSRALGEILVDRTWNYSALHVKLHKQTHKNLFVYICNGPHQHHNVTMKVGMVTMSCFCHIQQIYTNRFL
jgi:hypothetical protein